MQQLSIFPQSWDTVPQKSFVPQKQIPVPKPDSQESVEISQPVEAEPPKIINVEEEEPSKEKPDVTENLVSLEKRKLQENCTQTFEAVNLKK